MKFRICTECTINHYQNCNTCFGWGVYKIINKCVFSPVTGYDIFKNKFRGKLYKCPECKSSIKGLPFFIRWKVKLFKIESKMDIIEY